MERILKIVDHYQRQNNNQILFDKQAMAIPRCRRPWTNLVINQQGESYICSSPAWLPKSIGSILDYDNFLDLLNSYEARSIRSEVASGRYMYCNHKICQHLTDEKFIGKYNTTPLGEDQLLSEEQFTDNSQVNFLPSEICFDFDYTCNFRCPSCRTEMINHNHGPVAEFNQRLVDRIKNSILSLYITKDTPVSIRWAGGEPFLSHAYLDLWDFISQQPNRITNVIQTNGSYLRRRHELLNRFLPHVSEIRISFDAGTSDTYEKIRVNGKWDELLDNCRYIKDLIDNLGTNTLISSEFVIQLDNYKEIPKYIEIAKNLRFDSINLTRMWNWDTWSIEEFTQRDVFNPLHKNYNELIEILNQYKQDKKVYVY